jgi:hypothetical protein
MPEYTFRAAVTLVDSKQLKTTLAFPRVIDDLSPEAAFVTANTELGELVTDLQAVTDCAINRVTLSFLDDSQLEAVPAPGVADMTDEAAISVWLSDVGELDKFATLRIPGPIAALMQSDQKTVDVTNANLIAYVENFGPDKFEVSDGEAVVISRDNGIEKGHWRSKAKSTAS